VDVLAVIHGAEVRSGVFGDAVAERGHGLDEWSLAWGKPPPRPLDDYGAVMVFGGAMHADQDDRHPWLVEENFFLQRLLGLDKPILGVCLGAQLLAKAAHSGVSPAREPEVGWFPVELTSAAREDPVLGRLPQRFDAFQWHFYTYDLPARAVELAASPVCTQAFRLGRAAWGIQFHAEVTLEQVRGWVADEGADIPGDPDELLAETEVRIAGWNELGRGLCESFLDVAERVAERTASTS
jgi:GMP synthase-like glutamine amidotransferase